MPDSDQDVVRVIIDDVGDVLVIPRKTMEVMALFPGDEHMIGIQMEDRVYRALTLQVRKMLEKWPWKKAGVWGEG